MDKNKFIHIFISLTALFLAVISCTDEFTSKSSYHLSYSTDTVRFDTIFTEQVTPTRTLMIYNETDKNIQIASVALVTSQPCYKINLNGKIGTSFENVDIYANDSLYLFIQLYIDELKQNDPKEMEGYIEFQYNGNTERIVLTAWGQDAHKLTRHHIHNDTTWTNEQPFIIYDSLIVDEEATLTIKEGTKIYFHDGASMLVNGRLIINGALNQLVEFRGERTDNLYADVNYDKLSNQWEGIRISETSHGNRIEFAHIRNGKYGIIIDSSSVEENHPKLVICNSDIHNFSQVLLSCTNANVQAYNCVFSNGSNGCIRLQGGDYLFNHCTVAGYNKGAGTYRFAVVIANQNLTTEGEVYPTKVEFNNSIIYGSMINELYFVKEESETTFDYKFNHCLIRYENAQPEMITEESFVDVLWNKNPGFIATDEAERNFNFHLNIESEIIGLGDLSILEMYPECMTDKEGHTRLEREAPDLGAYQFVEEEHKE